MKKYLSFLLFTVSLHAQIYSIGDTIPNFTFPLCANGDGQDSISLYDYLDELPCGTNYNSILLVWMYSWDGWLGEENLEPIEEYYDEDNGRIVIGMGADFGQPYNCEDYPSQFNITFPILDQTENPILNWFGSGYIPFSCVINYDMTLYNVPDDGSGIVLDMPELPSPYEAPYIPNLDNQSMNEDETFFPVCQIENGNDFLEYSVESSSSDVIAAIVSHDEEELNLFIEPNDNWSGECLINIEYTDTQCSTTPEIMTFHLTVVNVNDSPEPFELIYPTLLDTIEINTDTDETFEFYWEASQDVDSDINYNTVITLDYFGDIYSEEYPSTDSSVTISGYEWSTLMTNLNLERWTLQYTVQASDEENIVESEIGEFVFENMSLSTKKDLIPLSFSLHQNYPNPFNPITTLRYELPEDGFVNMSVYDMVGNEINQLVNEVQNSGFKSVQWNATNNQGQPVSAGVYLYSIEAGDFRQTKKMILLK